MSAQKYTMKPFFSTNNITLYQADAIEILNSFDAGSTDLIFADPPYNLSNDGTTCHGGKRVSVNKGKWDASCGVDADFTFHSEWIAACRRVLKPNGSLWISGTYHSIYACGFALQQQGWHLVNDICWYKPNAAPNLACRMFTASHETLLWARKDKRAKHYFNYDLAKGGNWEGDTLKKPDKQMRSVWVVNPPRNDEKRFGKHPTQKPEALLERIVLTCSREGDIILDPFCGSGTTGVVALRYKRKFIGIDMEKSYLDTLAIPRIEAVLKSAGR